MPNFDELVGLLLHVVTLITIIGGVGGAGMALFCPDSVIGERTTTARVGYAVMFLGIPVAWGWYALAIL